MKGKKYQVEAADRTSQVPVATLYDFVKLHLYEFFRVEDCCVGFCVEYLNAQSRLSP